MRKCNEGKSTQIIKKIGSMIDVNDIRKGIIRAKIKTQRVKVNIMNRGSAKTSKLKNAEYIDMG